jgi:hypothetical protein
MGGLEIAALIFSLFVTYGPKAKDIYDEWQGKIVGEPTAADWAVLKKKIDEHNPDTY